ncbi:MAG: ATP-binding protein [Dysgonamonadaceae bacterium]|nr:ATP-binding protein [Dysgonamonadaceae bacterium]MDD4729459.1 ATP-binding protein [Dysgonamonadaceae bacterium]
MEKSLSKINTIITEKYLREQIENQYFERKGLGDKDIKPTKIASELIGMLNADGGILVFGISDKGEIEDLNTLGVKLNDYRKLVFDFINPPCNIEVEELEIHSRLIFIYHVEQEIERVFCRKDNEDVFLRVHDTNRKLDRERIMKLEYDKSIRRFEEEVVQDFDIDDFDWDLLQEYKEKLNYNGEVLDLLVKRHLANKKEAVYKFKKSAILLFAKDPEKYIPSASVRYVRYQGTEPLTGVSHNVIKDVRFENNIPRLINEIKQFLRTSFKDYHFLDIQDGRFKKIMEYPEEAWLEGLVNALCHRSYNIQGSAIYIKHFDNHLEISNSGPLPAQVTVENIKTERFARNPRVARVLEDMGYVRQLNEGVSRIYEYMEKSMLSSPEYVERNRNIYLTLRNRISNHSKAIDEIVMKKITDNWNEYNDTQRKIILFLFMHHQGTVEELEEYTMINKNTIRGYLNKYIKTGVVERRSKKQRDINAMYAFKKH